MRKKLGWLLAAMTLGSTGFAVYLSLDPSLYFFYGHEDRSLWAHPTGHVAFVCSFLLAETVLFSVVLLARRPARLWLRAILGLSVLGPWAFITSLGFIHMPGYVVFHNLWLWLLLLVLALVQVASLAKNLFRIWKNRSKGTI